MGQLFTEAERVEVWDRWEGGESMRSIARQMGRPASTVSREIARNGGVGRYRAHVADRAAMGRARRPKRCKLAANPGLALVVTDKLPGWWSPEQIAAGYEQSSVPHSVVGLAPTCADASA